MCFKQGRQWRAWCTRVPIVEGAKGTWIKPLNTCIFSQICPETIRIKRFTWRRAGFVVAVDEDELDLIVLQRVSNAR
jgi:hypothetical protein